MCQRQGSSVGVLDLCSVLCSRVLFADTIAHKTLTNELHEDEETYHFDWPLAGAVRQLIHRQTH